MAVQPKAIAKTAHVNLMTDNVIANLPIEGLRSIIRGVLATDSSVTPIFEQQARNYLQKTDNTLRDSLFTKNGSRIETTPTFCSLQSRIRTMLGCGLCYQSLPLLTAVVDQSAELVVGTESTGLEGVHRPLSSIDGDIILALTAIEKTRYVQSGLRDFTTHERRLIDSLSRSLEACFETWKKGGGEFPFERALISMGGPLTPSADQKNCYPNEFPNGFANGHSNGHAVESRSHHITACKDIETFQVKDILLPRLFSGLWQLSSPSWGVASMSKIRASLSSYVNKGFTAFDMADHYGDAEIIFGKFRASTSDPKRLFASTKYCVFRPLTVTPEVIQSAVTERCQRLHSNQVDLLQFHWQFYDDPQYIQALQHLQADPRVRVLGLCNFDTQRMEHIIASGIQVSTNQVQFSLVDSRPTFKMGAACTQHNIKLLTYGTLCGGFIAEKWLGQPEPELFEDNVTPSQRKYYEMISAWGGWILFQELLTALRDIAIKHRVSISNVATRWVLDFPYVGAVIVGARMGVSEHTNENLASYGWHLDAQDRAVIDRVLSRSRRKEMFDAMGDCGGEYR